MDNLLNMLTNIKVVDGSNGFNDNIKKVMTNPIIAGLVNTPEIQSKVKEVTDNPMTQMLIKMFAESMENHDNKNNENNKNDCKNDDSEDDDAFTETSSEESYDRSAQPEYEWDNCNCSIPCTPEKSSRLKQSSFSFVSDFYNTLWSPRSVSILSNYFTSNSQYVKTNYDGEMLWTITGRKKIMDYLNDFWMPSHDTQNTQVNSFTINLVNDSDIDAKIYEIKYSINQPIMDIGDRKSVV